MQSFLTIHPGYEARYDEFVDLLRTSGPFVKDTVAFEMTLIPDAHPDPPQTMSEYFQYLKYFIYLYRNNATVCTCIKEITGGNSTSTKKP